MSAFTAVNLLKARSDRLSAVQQQVALSLARLQTNLDGPLWNFDRGQVEQTLRAERGAEHVVGPLVTQGPKVLGGVATAAGGKPVAIDKAPGADDQVGPGFGRPGSLPQGDGGRQGQARLPGRAEDPRRQTLSGARPRGRPQWLIIQGRFDGNAFAPLAAVTVAPRRPGEQQPQPAGWRMRA